MEKITNYVNNVFDALPRTKETLTMKLNMCDSMTDKYDALIQEGKNENEAFGIVIASFGSIDEIKSELGIVEASIVSNEKNYLEEEYYAFKNRYNVAMPFAIALIFITIGVTYVLSESFDALAPIAFLLMMGTAVGILVFFSMKKTDYDKLMCFDEPRARSGFRLKSGTISSLGVFVYLIIGFLFDGWHPWWLIIPVCGFIDGYIIRY